MMGFLVIERDNFSLISFNEQPGNLDGFPEPSGDMRLKLNSFLDGAPPISVAAEIILKLSNSPFAKFVNPAT